MRLAEKVALVTGAGLGMGRATASLFAAQGAKIFAVDLGEEELERTRSLIEEAGGQCAVHRCDVSDSGAVADAFAALREHYGRLDILVNNAGIGSAPGDGQERYMELMAQRSAGDATVFADHIVHMEDAGWQKVVDVNLNGSFFCSREAVRLMSAAEDGGQGGSIINISSTSALNGDGGVHYCASKAALLGLSRSLARELAPRGIRVNAICPGPTNTRLMQGISEEWAQSIIQGVPLGRLAEPEEVAHAALFLASGDSSFVTGQTLACNGGLWML